MNALQPVTPMMDVFTKALVAKIIAIDKRGDIAAIARNLYPNTKGVTEAAINPGDYIRRATTNPAMTTVSGWAAELAAAKVAVDFLSSLAPRSAYAALSAIGLRVDLAGAGLATIPAWNTVANGSFFLAEGQPASVRQSSLARSDMTPKKGVLISVFTAELANHSTPSIEAILRAGLESDAWAETDTVLLGNSVATAAAPAGIRAGAAVITPATGGGAAALGADLSALATAVSVTGPVQRPTYILNPVDLVRALAVSPALNGEQVTLISSPYQPVKVVTFLDAASFASATRDEPEVSVSREPTLVMRSPDPAAVTDAAGVRGTPTTSTWQIDAYAIRTIIDLTWGVIPARVSSVSAVTW